MLYYNYFESDTIINMKTIQTSMPEITLTKPNVDRDLILEKAKRSIHEKFGIKHATIQLEGKNICLSEDSCN